MAIKVVQKNSFNLNGIKKRAGEATKIATLRKQLQELVDVCKALQNKVYKLESKKKNYGVK